MPSRYSTYIMEEKKSTITDQLTTNVGKKSYTHIFDYSVYLFADFFFFAFVS